MDFIKFQFPTQMINGEEYFVGVDDAGVLKQRRKHLGLTQQQVAKYAGIQVKQYQRLESGERSILGASMRIGLAICAVLKLDPYDFITNAENMNNVIKVTRIEPDHLPPMEIDLRGVDEQK